jgi:hypothetical protein
MEVEECGIIASRLIEHSRWYGVVHSLNAGHTGWHLILSLGLREAVVCRNCNLPVNSGYFIR